MCGATGAEKSAQQNEAGLSNSLTNAFGQVFGRNSNIMQSVGGVMTPIVNAGLNQRGFSPTETAAETTNIADQGAADTNAVENSVNEKMAQTGQANPSAVAGVDAAVAQKGQQSTAQQQNQFNVENAEQGEKNFFNASGDLTNETTALEGGIDAAGGAASGADQSAMTGAQDIQQANDAWMAPVAAIAGGALGGALGKGGALNK